MGMTFPREGHMAIHIGRREFITLLGGAATWPIAAHAQQRAMSAVGFLHPSSPEAFPHIVEGFRRGLGDTGFVEGQNVTIEYRWARGEYHQLPRLAVELVQRGVRVILAGGGEASAFAAKAATATVPILIIAGSDHPVWLPASTDRAATLQV
jgi:putative ABC transport system substrate-binding protein